VLDERLEAPAVIGPVERVSGWRGDIEEEHEIARRRGAQLPRGRRLGQTRRLPRARAARRRADGEGHEHQHRRGGTAPGTGCRLASAIAALLARGASLEDAVRGAKRIVERYLDRAAR